MKNLKSIKKLITNTPLIKISYKFKNIPGIVYAKCEWYSLTGSVKDKVAYQILTDAYKNKKLKTGDKICEVSSGNMGISICAMGNLLGNPVTILMPKNMSEERKKLLKLYGATLVETNNFEEAFALNKSYIQKGYFCSQQFENKSNIKAHYSITAKEIYKKIKNLSVKTFVAGVGTSGTLIGIGTYLKEKQKIEINAIEPKNARIITGKKPFKKHQLQGLSDEILPKLYNSNLINKVIQITDEDALAISQKLCSKLSLGVGISSGANFLGAVLSGYNSLTIFPDDNKKYLSTNLSKNIETELTKQIELLNVETV